MNSLNSMKNYQNLLVRLNNALLSKNNEKTGQRAIVSNISGYRDQPVGRNRKNRVREQLFLILADIAL